MNNNQIIPQPIFKNKLNSVNWIKIYVREYGVQYSEGAILCLSPLARDHIPAPSQSHLVIPEGQNTAFYIDKNSWTRLVESLIKKYTLSTASLGKYEKQFELDGSAYVKTSLKLSKLDYKNLDNKKLLKYYLDYQKKLINYSLFGWTAFILNNSISEKAAKITVKYLKLNHLENRKDEILTSLFAPPKRAAVLALQDEVAKYRGKLSPAIFKSLYGKYKWLSCLDIHNKPWTGQEFREHIKSFSADDNRRITPFRIYSKMLKINGKDLEYLLMAKKFVYIKDARDDYRRKGVYFAGVFFRELEKRMGLSYGDSTYLQYKDVVSFLSGKKKISDEIIAERKRGFILYMDKSGKIVCLSGNIINPTLKYFGLNAGREISGIIRGAVASKGNVKGIVAVVRGVKDLPKVKKGNILVAVTTHPDYVPAMRRAAAIVTDEGGITSHAAIVAREFGIPCIVGTHDGTSLLHDGDRISVDAVKGVISKI